MEIDQCFQELTAMNTTEWTNIPAPLIKAMATIKKCVSSQIYAILDNNERVTVIGKNSDMHLREFESDIK